MTSTRQKKRVKPDQKHQPPKRFWRLMLFILLFLLLCPFVLLCLYRLPFIHPPSTLMVKDMVMLRNYKREWRGLLDISPYLVRAVAVSEDARFCLHNGVDWGAMHHVMRQSRLKRGASTITMQSVKNLFLWHDRSFIRKGIEVPYAVVADTVLPKARIMEIYLNIAEWGPGIYGAEAASQYYYGRSAKNLTRQQALYLAISLPNPYVRNPKRPSFHMQKLAQLTEKRLAKAGPYLHCLP